MSKKFAKDIEAQKAVLELGKQAVLTKFMVVAMAGGDAEKAKATLSDPKTFREPFLGMGLDRKTAARLGNRIRSME